MKDSTKNSFSKELSEEEIQQLLSEIPKMTPEESAVRRKSMQKIQEEHDHMLYEKYPKLSLYHKRQMWYYFLQHQELSRENYEKWKSVEPEIDLMMDSYLKLIPINEKDYLRMGRTDYQEVIKLGKERYLHLYEEPKKWWEFWK